MQSKIPKTLTIAKSITKCHAELVGEGVEYIWACAKGAYRRSMNSCQKKGKDNFKASVHHCLSEEVLAKVRIKKFAQQARHYVSI
jgi:hypothetical protein